MTTFYLDLEGGNDANDGTTFANRWLTFASGATAARIAPGDTIRVKGSPAPTSLGQAAQWTSAKTPAGVTPTSSTNATPIVVTKNAHGLSNGNTVAISGHQTNTNANGTWTIANVTTNTFELVGSVGNGVGGATGSYWNKTNAVVTLTTAVTANIASTASGIRTAWTASANVTTSLLNTDYKAGYQSDSIAIAAGFTTGLAAYSATGTLNLSTYKQVSFWIKQTAGTIGAASSISLTLCSDAAGVTAVNTINVPLLGALNQWQSVTVDTGGALGSSIQSIGFVVNTDNAAQTFLLSNIIACKDSTSNDSLTLSSLIGKNDGLWWGIQSIDGTRVILDCTTNTLPTAITGYYGVTESVTTYKREPMPIGTVATSASLAVHVIQDNGTSGSPITFSGGWNRTDMSTQTDQTWLDGRNGFGAAIATATKPYVTMEKFGLVRYGTSAFSPNSASNNFIFTNCQANNCTTGFGISGSDSQLNTCIALCNGTGISITGARTVVTGLTVLSSSSNGVSLNATDIRIDTAAVHNTGAFGISFTAALGTKLKDVSIFDGASSALNILAGCEVFGTGIDLRRNLQGIIGGCVGEGVILFGSSNGNTTLYVGSSGAIDTLRNWTSTTDTTLVTPTTNANNQVYFDRYGNTDDDHRVYGESFLIQTDVSVRNTAADYSWKCVISSATVRPSTYPVVISLGKYRVLANVMVTATLYVRRDDTAAFVALLAKGGQLPGVGSIGTDVSTTISAAINTWQQITITFTPTQAGWIELFASFWATTANKTTWIDDLVVSQAGLPTVTNGLNYVDNGRIKNPGGAGGGLITARAWNGGYSS